MYNRYIGNTGKYQRVEETQEETQYTAPQREQAPPPPPPAPDPKPEGEKKGFLGDLGGIFGNLGNLFKNDSGGGGFLKSILPKNMDTGDILVLLILLFVYLESKDEEILIILIAMVVMGMK